MIATADGRATIAGRTAPIANRADYELFHALRERVDAVMVGAETVRVEGYGPMAQLAVVVSRSVELPVDRGLLAAAEQPRRDRHAVARPRAAAVRRERQLPARGRPRRGAAAAARRARRGARSTARAGPGSTRRCVPAGLVDELHLVIAPKLAGGRDPLTILSGDTLEPPRDLALLSLHESGGYLFARYGLS